MSTTLLSAPSSTRSPTTLHLDRNIAVGLGKDYLWQRIRTCIALATTDAVAVASVLVLTILAARFIGLAGLVTIGPVVMVGVGWMAMFTLLGLYPAIGIHPAAELKRYATATTVITMGVAVALASVNQIGLMTLTGLCAFWLVSCFLLPAVRITVRSSLSTNANHGVRCIVVGRSAIEHVCRQHPLALARLGYRVVGSVSQSERYWNSSNSVERATSQIECLGPLSELHELCSRHRAPAILISADDNELAQETINCLRLHIPRIERLETNDVGFGQERCLGLGTASHAQNGLLQPGKMFVKRCMDVVIVLAAAPILLPLMCCIALAIELTSNGSVFYRQRRIGRYGRTLKIWKFRTMVQNADEVLQTYLDQHPELDAEWEANRKLKQDPRVTRIGAILRKTSLDELPQIFNVLTGDMSLVGPRPVPVDDIDKYAEAYLMYAAVKPGLTGLWQVSGRNNTTYDERIAMDRFYVSTWSVSMDVYILLRTLKTVALCEGAY